MDMKKMTQVLNENNLSLEDVIKLSKKMNHYNFNDKKDLSEAIDEISIYLGKKITDKQKEEIYQCFEKGNFKV